jgi:diguanylate cyclase
VRGSGLNVHFQAIYAANTLEVLGFEALLRWTYNDKAIAPDVFVPLAEQSSLIFEVGAWALERACTVAAGWRDKSVSVNVSSRQFDQEGFVATVQRALQHSGLAAERLVLEITESALLERAEANFVALRALGVQVQVDDFGTGYSNLSYLNRFPVSALKIDKRFVAGIEQNETRSVVQAIIALARSLGLQVIAEGVETQAQLEWLRGLGCDAVQGYLLAKPVPVEALLEVQR